MVFVYFILQTELHGVVVRIPVSCLRIESRP